MARFPRYANGGDASALNPNTTAFEPPARQRVAIVLPPNQDPQSWSAPFESGDVATQWPYGLDLLRKDFDIAPVVSGRLNLAQLARATLRTTQKSLGARRRRQGEWDTEIAFSWDENLAIRSIAQVRAERYVTGSIWITDDILNGKRAVRRLFLRHILRQFDGIFFSSQAQMAPARIWLASSRIQLKWIPMAVASDYFVPSEYPSEPFVFSMGNDKHRDPAALARVLGLVAERNSAVEFLVQTNYPRAFPKEIATVERLSPSEVKTNYGRAGAVALAVKPNVHVSGVTVALEAMSSARPIIMTANPGIEDYVHHGQSGFLVPYGDDEAFADRILQVVTNPELGERMGNVARHQVESHFDLRIMNDEIARFIASTSST